MPKICNILKNLLSENGNEGPSSTDQLGEVGYYFNPVPDFSSIPAADFYKVWEAFSKVQVTKQANAVIETLNIALLTLT